MCIVRKCVNERWRETRNLVSQKRLRRQRRKQHKRERKADFVLTALGLYRMAGLFLLLFLFMFFWRSVTLFIAFNIKLYIYLRSEEFLDVYFVWIVGDVLYYIMAWQVLTALSILFYFRLQQTHSNVKFVIVTQLSIPHN